MSRSLGDWAATGVIPDPTVDVVDIDELIASAQDKFAKEQCSAKEDAGDASACQGDDISLDASEVHILAISATDGMLDYLPLEQIAYVFAASMFVQKNPHPLTAAEYLILTAAEHWQQEHQGEYRDDIAVAAVSVLRRPPNHSPVKDDANDDNAKNKPTIVKEKDDSSSTSSTNRKTSNVKEADENTQGEEL